MWIIDVFSPFYDFPRRKLGIPMGDVRRMLANHAVASLNGKVVELRNGPDVVIGRAGVGHGKHAVRWVNEFNRKARAS